MFRILRFLRPGRFASIILITLGICLFALFVLWPSYTRASTTRAIAAALRNAQSVTAIEFVRFRDTPAVAEREVVLRSVALSSEQILQFQATGGLLDFGSPLPPLCFEPHHRVDVLREDGTAFRFEVCFLCSNFCINNGPIQNISSRWLPLLSQFFSTIGMPPRNQDEYRRVTPTIR